MLRIVSGFYKNTRIEQPDKKITRASSEKLREAIFSSIAFELQNKRFLDCFAGSGVFGFEALSRGCNEVCLIEKSRDAFKIIKQNALKFKDENIILKNTDCFKILAKKETQAWDFVFLDPPYKNKDYYFGAMKLLIINNWINEDSIVITESNFDIESVENYVLIKTKKYGIAVVNYWQKA